MYFCSPAQYTDLQMAQRIGILSVLAANCSCLPQVNLLQQINLVRLQQQCGCPVAVVNLLLGLNNAGNHIVLFFYH